MAVSRFFRFACLAAALCLCACGGKEPPVLPPAPKPAPVENPADIVWNFQPRGIRVILQADGELNVLGDNPLALSLCVYQLKSENPFATLAATQQGLLTFLDCGLADPSIVSAKRIYVQPGREDAIFLDRAEGAKYLAVAAGFNNLRPELCIKVVPMPVHSEKTGVPPFRTTFYEAADMDAFVAVTREAVNLTGAERVQ